MDHQAANPLDKPVLDEAAFHQLLAAAYTLQEENDQLLSKRARAEFVEIVSEATVAGNVLPLVAPRPETLAVDGPLELIPSTVHADPESLPHHPAGDSNRIPNFTAEIPQPIVVKQPKAKPTRLLVPQVPTTARDVHPRTAHVQIIRNNAWFWRVATAVAMGALLALLLSVSIDRFSPLPAGLVPPSEAGQQLPFRTAKPIVTVLAHGDGSDAKKNVIKDNTETNAQPTEPSMIADQPSAAAPMPAPSPRTIAKRKRRHSIYPSESDVVAPDTVVRYGATPRVQPQKKP